MKPHGCSKSMFFVCGMKVEHIPPNIYLPRVAVMWSRREIISAVMSVHFSWTRIICLIFLAECTSMAFETFGKVLLTFFFFVPATSGLFHFFSSSWVLSLPSVRLNLLSAFIVLGLSYGMGRWKCMVWCYSSFPPDCFSVSAPWKM